MLFHAAQFFNMMRLQCQKTSTDGFHLIFIEIKATFGSTRREKVPFLVEILERRQKYHVAQYEM